MNTRESPSSYDQLKASIEAHVPVSAATVLRGPNAGEKMLVYADRHIGTLGDSAFDLRVIESARRLLGEGLSETLELNGPDGPVEVFFESFPPPPELIIFGAVHVAQPLTTIAKQLGYKVVVVDVREKLATEERFPDADEIVLEWPDVALSKRSVDASAAIAILSHDPKFDEPALLGSLSTPARYIGAVGSRSTNQDRRERLKAAGVDDDNLQRVRGPIGLNIGASTPEEMAISIMAEIIAARHGRMGGPLTTATGKIRARA